MNTLQNNLLKIYPEHDTPVGLVHPYWARKPLNIINTIVSTLSQKGDLILDPFAGSGTTIFSALLHERNIIGSDINPLSVFIISSLLSLQKDTERKLNDVGKFISDCAEQISPLYKWTEKNFFVERERFIVHGEYKNGNFLLEPIEIILKQNRRGRWSGRTVLTPPTWWKEEIIPNHLTTHPIDFTELHLIPNSRIAIPEGANLSHYYSPRNQAAINIAFKLINSDLYYDDSKEILRLLLSSTLPLLRLSDKKASSQWPYWRPKNALTSRNPVMVLEKRVEALKNASDWLCKNIKSFDIVPLEDIKQTTKTSFVSIINSPVQNLCPQIIHPHSIDLLITDPPYADQAPYLEYSSLWSKILNLPISQFEYSLEIVKTDAPSRTKDSDEYIKRLCKGLEVCCKLVKHGGYLVWFYQDYQLKHWAEIAYLTRKQGFQVFEVISIPKQRRSMKTVTSPGKTLDGDLILVFQNTGVFEEKKSLSRHLILKSCEDVLKNTKKNTTFFEKYSEIIRIGFQEGWMEYFVNSEVDVKKLIQEVEVGIY